MFYNFFFFENRAVLGDNVERDGKAGQATDDSIIWCMPIACWITKATDVYSEHVIRTAFPRQLWLRDAPQCCVIRTLLVRFIRPIDLALYVHCSSGLSD
jgi:hypothetical protein